MKPWIPSLHTGRVMGLAKTEKKKKKQQKIEKENWVSFCLVPETQIFETIQKTFYPILCYRTAELYNGLCCCSLLTIQISFFSSEVCRKVKQTVYGWPRDSTYAVCSSVTEDFNCFNLFVVKLFIKRFPNYFIHLDFLIFLVFKVYFISMT